MLEAAERKTKNSQFLFIKKIFAQNGVKKNLAEIFYICFFSHSFIQKSKFVFSPFFIIMKPVFF